MADRLSSDAPYDVPTLRFPAVSLADIVGDQDRFEVLRSVLLGLEAAWSLCAQDRGSLPQLWQPHCWLTGRRVRCQTGADSREGICQGIDELGRLLLDGGSQIYRCLGGTIDLADG
jgi:biotin-(acetyl-CoA carboxylase) ligase